MANNEKEFDRLTVTNIPIQVKSDLEAIAKNEGTTVSALVKPVLRELRDKYPISSRTIQKD